MLEISEDAFDDCFDVSNYNLEHEEQWTDVDKLQAMGQHKFTHVYVSHKGNALGVWELPCSIPILDITDDDSTSINIVPCFKKNGQSSTIKGYGFAKSYQYTTSLKKGSTTKITKADMLKHYEYHRYASFKLIEPFSSQNSFSPYNTFTSIANFDCVIDPSDPSNRIGVITLTDDSLKQNFELVTPEMNFTINYMTYLEMRYKCENDLNIEIYAPDYSNIYPCGGLFATDDWQTVYINLNERLVNIYNMGNFYSGGIKAKVLLSGAKLEDRDTHFYVDYVKIITGPQS